MAPTLLPIPSASLQYADTETQLICYGYRYYNPSMGRWLGRDPMGEKGGLHLYAFCRNNAINAYDALGMYTINDVYGGIPDDDVFSHLHPTFEKMEGGWYDPATDRLHVFHAGSDPADIDYSSSENYDAPVWQNWGNQIMDDDDASLENWRESAATYTAGFIAYTEWAQQVIEQSKKPTLIIVPGTSTPVAPTVDNSSEESEEPTLENGDSTASDEGSAPNSVTLGSSSAKTPTNGSGWGTVVVLYDGKEQADPNNPAHATGAQLARLANNTVSDPKYAINAQSAVVGVATALTSGIDTHSANYVVVLDHGDSNWYGGMRQQLGDNLLTKNDMTFLGAMVKPGGAVVLYGCSAGDSSGYLQGMANAAGTRVYAFPFDVALKPGAPLPSPAPDWPYKDPVKKGP